MRAPLQGAAAARPFEFDSLGRLLYGSDETGWRGPAVQARLGSGLHQTGAIAFACTTIFLITKGQVETWIRNGRSVCHYSQSEGSLTLIDKSARFDAATWAGDFQVLAIQLPAEPHPSPFGAVATDCTLATQFAVRDRVLSLLLSRVATEVRAGCPTGPGYSELLSESLLSHVHARYGRIRCRSARRASSLPSALRRQIAALVADNLAGDLTLTSLASSVHVSHYHFARLFKHTFGMTPHQYIMQARMARARDLLEADRLSIAEVAQSVGFANQSQFSTAFRKATGIPPRTYRLKCR